MANAYLLDKHLFSNLLDGGPELIGGHRADVAEMILAGQAVSTQIVLIGSQVVGVIERRPDPASCCSWETDLPEFPPRKHPPSRHPSPCCSDLSLRVAVSRPAVSDGHRAKWPKRHEYMPTWFVKTLLLDKIRETFVQRLWLQRSNCGETDSV